jgi:hypothetical protein
MGAEADTEEKIYHCEVKKLFSRNGKKLWEWTPVPVADAIAACATQFRCQDCHGAVKLLNKNVEHGPAPHVVHRSRQDTEYCPAGIYFRLNPGRVPKMSSMPVK